MVYSIQNNVAYINGNKGIYDGKINDNSVRYGRNAAANNFEYLKKLGGKRSESTDTFNYSDKNYGNLSKTKLIEANSEKLIQETDDFLNSLPPLEFEYQYMPDGANGKNIDKMALLGAAFEEMGKKISIPVQEFTEKLKKSFQNADASAFDINKDGKVDNAEYSTSILVSDMLSKGEKLEASKIDGKINNNGLSKILPYTNAKNLAAASKNLADIYNAYNLCEAQKAFEANTNNILDINA